MNPYFALAALLLIGMPLWAQDSSRTQPAKAPLVAKPAASPGMQGLEAYQRTDQFIPGGPLGLVRTVDDRYEGLQGTPYLIPDWSRGELDISNGKRYSKIPLKFNAHKQELLVKRESAGGDSIILNPQQVVRFVLNGDGGEQYVFKRYSGLQAGDPNLRDGYYMVLFEGKNALLKRISKQFQPADYKGGYSNNIRYDSYTDAAAYYLLRPDKTLVKLKKSKKGMLDALSDKKAELENFISKEKLSFKSDEDLARLVQQYDSL